MTVRPFSRLTVVRLVTAPDAPPRGPDGDRIQEAHLAYLNGLVADGTILANGPFRPIDDPSLRGMSLYTVGAEEARRLAEADPGVRAGWFAIRVDEWIFPAVPRAIGDRTDLELDVPF